MLFINCENCVGNVHALLHRDTLRVRNYTLAVQRGLAFDCAKRTRWSQNVKKNADGCGMGKDGPIEGGCYECKMNRGGDECPCDECAADERVD